MDTTTTLADIEARLRAAIAAHSDALTQRDEITAQMSATVKRLAELEARRTDLMRRPLGQNEEIAMIEVAIGESEDRVRELRGAIRLLQPAVSTAATEVAALGGEGAARTAT